MGTLLGVFGTSRKEVWQQLADQIGGQFTEQGLLKRGKVTAKVAPWTVTFDTFARSAGKTTIPFTRLRAPYLNKDGFRFELYRASVFSGIGKFLGMQDVEVGHAPFDDDFIIKANNASLIAVITRWYSWSRFSSENICNSMKKHSSNDIISPKVTTHSGTVGPCFFLRLPAIASSLKNYAARSSSAGR